MPLTQKSDLEIIRESLFFDADWYEASYPDVKHANADPAEHFLRDGAAELRHPGPCFDTGEYLAKWPEVAREGINPLVHFARASDFAAQDVTLIQDSGLFDEAWYLERNPDVAAAGIDPVLHYVESGHRELRDPSPEFVTREYLDDALPIALPTLNPLVRYIRHGRPGSRNGVQGTPRSRSRHARHLDALHRKHARKVVFVTHDLNIGGAPKLMLSIARWFQDATDYDVRIVAMRGGPLLAEAQRIAPTHVVGELHVADEDVSRLNRELRAFLVEEPAFTFINSAAAGHYCNIDPFQAPTFAYVHERKAVLDHYPDQLEVLLRRAAHVFCGAAEVHDLLAAAAPAAAAKLSTRPSFIDPPSEPQTLSAREKSDRRKALGFRPERKLVVACGVAHWRKQPFVFVRVARALIVDLERDVDFLWVGDGEDLAEMKAMAADLGIADRIHFVGHQPDIRPFLACADVFALTSSEDPFPLVCLEAAAASAPSVVFREATGFSVVIEPPAGEVAGAAVPLGDEAAFVAAVDRLVTDDRAWAKAADLIRRRVIEAYTTDTACTELLVKIRDVAGLAPRVSVIVPTYNSAAYLEPRLDSLTRQTFRDLEILLFDDVSSDRSFEIISKFADHHPHARAVLADANSGSVFKAWERGIQAATGDLIWIAEADDWCEPDFLAKAVREFAVSGVRLVHGRSIPVDETGQVAGDWNDLYLDSIVPGLWHQSFCSPSAKEIHRSLGRANSIVNASGVVVRRTAAVEAIKVARDFRLAGDWAFYVSAVHGGRMAYCHEAINYHRRHTSSVTASIEGTPRYFEELMNVGALVRALYGDDEARDAAFRQHIEREARRFSYDRPLPAGTTPAGLSLPAPGVLYGVGDLSGGGAQMFAVRFVNRWQATRGPAVLFAAGHEPDHPATRSRIDPMIPVVEAADVEAEGGLAAFLESYGLDVVLTGHWWADLAIGHLQAATEAPAPWVVVMHGCHESVLENPESFPGYADHLNRAQRFASHWVWTADKNRRLFDEGHVAPRATSRIVNGFEPIVPSGLGRSDLGLPEDAVVFSLASRAIESKGWLVALEAFRSARATLEGVVDVRLQLIGDGPAAERIRGLGDIDGVSMIPHTDRLADYIAASDACLLPSWFVGESLPLVLIEFLAQGKPAVVSDIGACAWAIGENSEAGPAGLVLRRAPDGTVRAEDLAAVMIQLATDAELRKTLADRAPAAFAKFSMDEMVELYDRVIDSVAGGRRPDDQLHGTGSRQSAS